MVSPHSGQQGRQLTILFCHFIGNDHYSYNQGVDLLPLMSKSLVVIQNLMLDTFDGTVLDKLAIPYQYCLQPDSIGKAHKTMASLKCPKKERRVNNYWNENTFAVPVIPSIALYPGKTEVASDIVRFLNGFEVEVPYCNLCLLDSKVLRPNSEQVTHQINNPWNFYTMTCNQNCQNFLAVLYAKFGCQTSIRIEEVIRLGFKAGLNHFEVFCCLSSFLFKGDLSVGNLVFHPNPEFKTFQEQIWNFQSWIVAAQRQNSSQARIDEFARLQAIADADRDEDYDFWDQISTFTESNKGPNRTNSQIFDELEYDFDLLIPYLQKNLTHYQSLVQLSKKVFG